MKQMDEKNKRCLAVYNGIPRNNYPRDLNILFSRTTYRDEWFVELKYMREIIIAVS